MAVVLATVRVPGTAAVAAAEAGRRSKEPVEIDSRTAVSGTAALVQRPSSALVLRHLAEDRLLSG